MIVDLLLDLIFGLLGLISDLLPSWSPAAFMDSWSLVVDNMAALNYFLPIGELFGITVAVFLVWPSMMMASIVAWLIALIRGGNARG